MVHDMVRGLILAKRRKPALGRGPMRLATVAIALLSAGIAQAQDMPPERPPEKPQVTPSPIACPATPALPAELAGWTRRTPLGAAPNAREAGANARLAVGSAVDGTLLATRTVRYALAPSKPGASTSFGGLYLFSVAEAGRYRVALGRAAWIDVVKDGKASVSTAHGHGPDCSNIRKMVDFALEPGDYLLQISGSPEGSMPLLVTRLP